MHFSLKTRGFTIVELLIVIVVVAVLAAVSISAYTGIQTRSINSKVLTAVTSWEKVLKMYKVIRGTLPLSDYNCLTSASTDFPAGSGLSAGECMHGFPYAPTFSAVYSSALTTDLESILGTTLKIPSGYLAPMSGTIGGTPIYVQGVRYNNQAIEYYLKGGAADCSKGTVMAGNSSDSLTLCSLNVS